MSSLPSDAPRPAASSRIHSQRLVSLDQFRGYTVAGMLLVNFLGGFAACPKILKHSHDYISYADTIMPHFLFAVGFAFRLTFGRRIELQGSSAAYARVVRRMFGLILVSVVVYHISPRADTWEKLTDLGFWGAIAEPLKRTWFQTLMHIAVTALWLVPVIRASAGVRIGWMVGSAAFHVLLSYWFNYQWVNTAPNGIDGGPLGFLTWVIPAGVGTLACDAILANPARAPIQRLLAWSAVLMLVGYVISCGTRLYDVPPEQVASLRKQKLADDPVWPQAERIERKQASGEWSQWLAEPPFVPPPPQEERKWNYWMMSQRGGTLSYLVFSAGLSLAVYVLFYLACDRGGWELGFFRTFGTNALLAYVLHEVVSGAVKPFMTKDAPGWYVTAGLLLFFAINWLFVRSFEKQGVYLKV